MWMLTTQLVRTQKEVKSMTEKIYSLRKHYKQTVHRIMDTKPTAGEGSKGIENCFGKPEENPYTVET